MNRARVAAAAGGVVALTAGSALGQLYSEDFSVDPTASWTVNNHPTPGTDNATNFFFDYSSVGIPSAPNTTDGSTRGMKLQANLSAGIFSGYSVSPTGQSFSGDYTLTFDLWSNFNGPLGTVGGVAPGGSGSTNLSTYGILSSGTTASYAGATDGVFFANTGDGGSSADWRAYSVAVPTSYADGDPVYAATTRNGSNPYYAFAGGAAAPAAQLALFPQQTGVTDPGAAGMAWHEVEIAKVGDIVTWRMDGVLLATVDTTGMAVGGGNILFGHSDINAGSSSDPNDVHLLFTLIDNVVVVPAPGAAGLLAAAGMLLVRRRR